ncbi:MAG: hypothetical protein IJA10_09370 [Lachnospiraceae bacterium]|nr:hypothetical protein [Lachnospiraceae bacterium]
MVKFIRKKLFDDNIGVRIVTLVCIFCFLFLGVTIISYYLLPEGFLRNKNSTTDFETSKNIFVGAMQIFLYNSISVFAIIFGSLFAKKKDGVYVSYGYSCFVVGIVLAAITLGTGSFTDATVNVPLLERLVSLFYVTKYAGLVEMMGQVLITCSLAGKALVMTEGKVTTTRKVKDLRCKKIEVAVFACGLLLMFLGAVIESNTIVNMGV